MSILLCVTGALLACTGSHGPDTSPGPAARELLDAPGFDWHTAETAHFRVHTPARSYVDAHVAALADSAERARAAALRLLGERDDVAGEPKAEIFFVDTRDDMRRLVRQPIGGFAQPGELTAVFVGGEGYRPFLRHELTHAYASVRWGRLEAGDWLTEGLGALAQGDCQGHSVDAIAAGYARKDSIRALWQTPPAGGHPLGSGGDSTEAEWRRQLATVPPAALDVPLLRRAGC